MPVLRFDQGTLVLEGISRGSMPRIAGAAPWAWDRRVGGWRCDALHYADVLVRIREARFHLKDEVASWRSVRWPGTNLNPLWDDQQAALDAWMKSKRGSIVMPTGTGKTEVALAIMAETAVSTLVVAPVRDLAGF